MRQGKLTINENDHNDRNYDFSFFKTFYFTKIFKHEVLCMLKVSLCLDGSLIFYRHLMLNIDLKTVDSVKVV